MILYESSRPIFTYLHHIVDIVHERMLAKVGADRLSRLFKTYGRVQLSPKVIESASYECVSVSRR